MLLVAPRMRDSHFAPRARYRISGPAALVSMVDQAGCISSMSAADFNDDRHADGDDISMRVERLL